MKDLAATVRRYISRYLTGKRDTVSVDENLELAYQLTRQDLWENRIAKEDDLEMTVIGKLAEFNLKVKHVYSLYLLICEEDQKEIENELQIRKNEEVNKKQN